MLIISIWSFLQRIVGPDLTPTISLIPNTPESMRRALDSLSKRKMGTPTRSGMVTTWILYTRHGYTIFKLNFCSDVTWNNTFSHHLRAADHSDVDQCSLSKPICCDFSSVCLKLAPKNLRNKDKEVPFLFIQPFLSQKLMDMPSWLVYKFVTLAQLKNSWNASYLRPLDQSFKIFHGSIKEESLITLVRLSWHNLLMVYEVYGSTGLKGQKKASIPEYLHGPWWCRGTLVNQTQKKHCFDVLSLQKFGCNKDIYSELKC